MTLTLALVLGVAVGILLGLLGGGGSILAVPVLVYALGMDLSEAIPTSLLVIGVASATGAIPKVRAKLVEWRLAAIFAATGIVGGEQLTRELSSALLTPLSDAERIKCEWGMALAHRVDEHDWVEVPSASICPRPQ